MSTKSQQFWTVAVLQIGLALCATSCSSTPETTSSETRVAPTPPGNMLESCECEEENERVTPAPLGESKTPPARINGAVIHRRPTSRAVTPLAPKMERLDRIEPMRRRAADARARFEFAAAAQMYRELRDHDATPERMRAAFHTALGESEDLATGIREIRHALDNREFTRANRRYRALSILHPGVPLACLLDLPGVRMPGTTLPTPGR